MNTLLLNIRNYHIEHYAPLGRSTGFILVGETDADLIKGHSYAVSEDIFKGMHIILTTKVKNGDISKFLDLSVQSDKTVNELTLKLC